MLDRFLNVCFAVARKIPQHILGNHKAAIDRSTTNEHAQQERRWQGGYENDSRKKGECRFQEARTTEISRYYTDIRLGDDIEQETGGDV